MKYKSTTRENITFDGATKYSVIHLLSSIEPVLNSLSDEDEIATASKVSWNGTITSSDNDGVLRIFLALVAISTANPPISENTTVGGTIEDVLDDFMDNEYAYQIMSEVYCPTIVRSAGLYIYKLAGTYQVPKGTIGLFKSDEQLEEPNLQSHLVLIGIKGYAGQANTDFISDGVVSIEYSIRKRSVSLAELS